MIKELTVAKWGNSLSVRLPKKALDKLGVVENDKVTLEVRDNEIILTPEKKTFIESLFDGFNPDEYYKDINGNLEDDWGDPVGNEEW